MMHSFGADQDRMEIRN